MQIQPRPIEGLIPYARNMDYVDVSSLIPYARNPRKNDHAVERVAAAIREFGFKVPIVAKSDGTIVDGHLRLKAAQKLGMETVPVLFADDLTDAQVKAFRISVNRMAELADWDNDLLALEFAELQEIGFDLDLTGFDADELEALAGSEENDVPQQSTAREVDSDAFEMEHKCPRCGFEFDNK